MARIPFPFVEEWLECPTHGWLYESRRRVEGTGTLSGSAPPHEVPFAREDISHAHRTTRAFDPLLEGRVGAVHGVNRAVIYGHFAVHHRIAGQNATIHGGAYTLLY